jgi:hypothetical protein
MSTATAATTTRFLRHRQAISGRPAIAGRFAAPIPDARVTSGIDRSIGIAD